MFRKIVSNLHFSPALVGQLGFYARRLKKEETTRRLGLVFTALALVVQSFAVFSPPEAANAASAADFVRGGVDSPAEFLTYYDRNSNNIRDIFKSLGITRAEIAATKQRTVSEEGRYNWSMTSLYSHAQGQRSWKYQKASGGTGTVYYRPMTLTQQGGPNHVVFAGYSKVFGWFAIKKDCGNLVTETPPRYPKPNAICENLRVEKLAPTRFRLTATASVKDGATIRGYDFAISHDGKTTTTPINTSRLSADFVYQNDLPGTYKAQVTVRSSAGPDSGEDCRNSFDINTKAACELVTAETLSGNRYRITGTASASKGVDVIRYVYTIKNSSGMVVATKRFASEEKRHSFVYSQTVPGKYRVSLKVVTSIGPKEGNGCRTSFNVVIPPRPVAECSSVKATISNRTIVSLTGSAVAANGATVSRYIFVVRDKSGSEIKRIPVDSTKLSVTAPSFTLAKPGDYSVKLTVITSLGSRTNDDNCKTAFKITNVEVCPYNPTLPLSSVDCQPCPDNPDIWYKDERCAANVISTKTSSNMTQGNVSATKTTARAGDKISYTLTVENRGLLSENVTLRENLEDVLEYASLVDTGGARFDKETKTLTWPAVNLAAGEKQSRTIAVQVLAKIPSTNTGSSNEASYDCTMVNTFGNSTSVDVDCAPEKVVVEQVVSELPKTGPRENMLFAAVLLSVVTYFYARSRQLGREVRLIRHNLNAGTI